MSNFAENTGINTIAVFPLLVNTTSHSVATEMSCYGQKDGYDRRSLDDELVVEKPQSTGDMQGGGDHLRDPPYKIYERLGGIDVVGQTALSPPYSMGVLVTPQRF
ncbi:hypothetical protein MKW98_005120 [Papaver atlanticum]|uniref:Uncharacterized protein n=1 Tax=Papaver atlanticum TaxID=357466 RepID=A0AAD4RW26_9MAGN|nr:hypothetical protein MKW98_005120 [Papaver atlanticum]